MPSLLGGLGGFFFGGLIAVCAFAGLCLAGWLASSRLFGAGYLGTGAGIVAGAVLAQLPIEAACWPVGRRADTFLPFLDVPCMSPLDWIGWSANGGFYAAIALAIATLVAITARGVARTVSAVWRSARNRSG